MYHLGIPHPATRPRTTVITHASQIMRTTSFQQKNLVYFSLTRSKTHPHFTSKRCGLFSWATKSFVVLRPSCFAGNGTFPWHTHTHTHRWLQFWWLCLLPVPFHLMIREARFYRLLFTSCQLKTRKHVGLTRSQMMNNQFLKFSRMFRALTVPRRT